MKPSRVLGGTTKTDRSSEFTADLLAAIFTWGGVGWLVDRWLETGPVFMLIGFVVGNMTGIYLLYIRSQDDDPPADAAPSQGQPEVQEHADPSPDR
ncbi:AtpZ/AtpI family protein [Euzebya tangerina]|uniref:AtpZ/AtpI family protein n=1 Tax=Euzebya tangerina TaxID=591198 RepID=UPI00196A25D9|nr:AtpZ/AtpI family protein [Euzebya tangerina]